MYDRYTITIEGRVSQKEVQEAVKEFGMTPFKNYKGFTGYQAVVDEPTANKFKLWHRYAEPAKTWIEIEPYFDEDELDEAVMEWDRETREEDEFEKNHRFGSLLRTSNF